MSRAFDEALAGAGGSLPVWLVLISLKSQETSNQRQLAESVGIQEATLSHHLNVIAEQGLVTRERDPANRRVHQVRLTEAGEAVFLRLRSAAIEFDRQLRTGLSDKQIATLERLLGRLADNVATLASPPAHVGVQTEPGRKSRSTSSPLMARTGTETQEKQ